MKLPSIALGFLLCFGAGAGTADFYMVDVGHGVATFVVAPSGETMLMDAGPTRAASRILTFMDQNGIRKIDYLVVSHFEDDHMGAAPAMAEKVPILNWVDHGQSVVYDKSDEWWKQRRGPWSRPGMGKQYDQSFDVFTKAREKGKHQVVKPGDIVPIKGMDVRVVTAGGHVLASPLKGAGGPNPSCANVDIRAEDDCEDGQSTGVVVGVGKFRFAYLGDLTWNTANSVFCPTNKVGTVDVYLITHHAQAMTNELGEYYHGLSCCSEAEVRGLHPRVALLTMGSEGHKQGTPEAMKTVHASPGLESLWQTEKVVAGGEAGQNAPDDFIANIGGPRSDQVPYIKVSVNPDGSFSVINSRNQFTKTYAARK